MAERPATVGSRVEFTPELDGAYETRGTVVKVNGIGPVIEFDDRLKFEYTHEEFTEKFKFLRSSDAT